MDSKLLEYLASIVNAGSLTRAAERQGVTQPTLTRAIQLMEERVGEPVLTRTRHGVRPTELGMRLADIGNHIIEEQTRADKVIRQWRQGYNYEVRVGVGPLLQHSMMNSFVETYPTNTQHVLHFITGLATILIPELKNGDLDLLLAPSFLDLDQSNLIRETVFHDYVHIMVGKKSRFYGSKRTIMLDELQHENWLLSGASAGLLDPQLNKTNIVQAGIIFTGSINMVTHLLSTSDVVVRMPVRLMLESNMIVAENIIQVQGESAKRDIAIWSTEAALKHPAVRRVRDLLRQHFHQLDLSAPQNL